MSFPPDRRAGHTLAELTAVLGALAIALATAAPVLTRTLDGIAVRAARDAVVAQLALGRLLARLHGGASVVLDESTDAVWIEGSDGTVLAAPLHLGHEYHASLELEGAERAVVVYDRLGLGRLANRTIRVIRGAGAARITVSAYGRVRAW